jgi:hypothetical protein
MDKCIGKKEGVIKMRNRGIVGQIHYAEKRTWRTLESQVRIVSPNTAPPPPSRSRDSSNIENWLLRYST